MSLRTSRREEPRPHKKSSALIYGFRESQTAANFGGLLTELIQKPCFSGALKRIPLEGIISFSDDLSSLSPTAVGIFPERSASSCNKAYRSVFDCYRRDNRMVKEALSVFVTERLT